MKNAMPACLQYFLPFAKDGINKQIELAILRADKMGVKVLSLAALNKVTNYYLCLVGWFCAIIVMLIN
jgi:hypothetical protein